MGRKVWRAQLNRVAIQREQQKAVGDAQMIFSERKSDGSSPSIAEMLV